MRSHLAAVLLGLALASALGGCATITTGTTQPINFDSEPQQAECTLTREGVSLGTVTTPAPLTIKRHASTIHVVCRKAGYEDARVIMNSRFETASAGNFLVGGIIGVMVDASSGANSRYESNVMVRLTPMSPADAAAAAARPQAAPAPQPVAVAAATPAAAAIPSTSATPVASSTPTTPSTAPPPPAESRVAAAAPPPPAFTGPFDGEYRGGMQLGLLAPGNSYQRVSEALRSIEVRVSGGDGIGSVRQQRCSGVGAVSLKIAPNGGVTGEMNALETDSCAPLKVQIEGRVDGDVLTVVATSGRASTTFSLRRATSP